MGYLGTQGGDYLHVSTTDSISLLAITTIFVVVLGTMHVGVQYSRGEIERYEGPNAVESQVRSDVWTSVNAVRADRGLDPAQRDASTRTQARDTARWLANTSYFEEPTAAGVKPGTERSLPNRMALCRQFPLKVTVGDVDSRVGENATFPSSVSRSIASRVTDLLATAFDVDVLGRTNEHKHGVGVVVRGDAVFVVYRTCNLGY